MPGWQSEYYRVTGKARRAAIRRSSKFLRDLNSEYARLLLALDSAGNAKRVTALRGSVRKLLLSYADEFGAAGIATAGDIAKMIGAGEAAAIKAAMKAGGFSIGASFTEVPQIAIEQLALRRGFGYSKTFRTLAKRNVLDSATAIDNYLARSIATGVDPKRMTKDLAVMLSRKDPEVLKALKHLGPNGGRLRNEIARRARIRPEALGRAKSMLYDARRIAVTETNTIRWEATRLAMLKNPLVKACKWELSSRHGSLGTFCECDVMADQNLYELGGGVYYLESVPARPHPFCACNLIAVLLPIHELEKGRPSPVPPRSLKEKELFQIRRNAMERFRKSKGREIPVSEKRMYRMGRNAEGHVDTAYKVAIDRRGGPPIARPAFTEADIRDGIKLVEAGARQFDEAISGDLVRFVEQADGEMLGLKYRHKSAKSIRSKFLREHNENNWGMQQILNDDINDALRYTMVWEDAKYADGIQSVMQQMIDRGYRPTKFKNVWGGDVYKGINANFVSPEGYVFELQFHTPESFFIKDTVIHGYYEAARVSIDPVFVSQMESRMASCWKSFQHWPEELVGQPPFSGDWTFRIPKGVKALNFDAFLADRPIKLYDLLDDVAAKRSAAARKAWATRRAKAAGRVVEKPSPKVATSRSEAARKAWATRRAKAAGVAEAEEREAVDLAKRLKRKEAARKAWETRRAREAAARGAREPADEVKAALSKNTTMDFDQKVEEVLRRWHQHLADEGLSTDMAGVRHLMEERIRSHYQKFGRWFYPESADLENAIGWISNTQKLSKAELQKRIATLTGEHKPNPKRLARVLAEVEEEIADLATHEVAYILDDAGNILARIEGTKSSVEFDLGANNLIKAAQKRGRKITITHNHPSISLTRGGNTTLSWNDVAAVITSDASEIRAVARAGGKEGRMVIVRMRRKGTSWGRFREEWRRAHEDLRLLHRDQFGKNADIFERQDWIWRELAKRYSDDVEYVLEYKRPPLKDLSLAEATDEMKAFRDFFQQFGIAESEAVSDDLIVQKYVQWSRGAIPESRLQAMPTQQLNRLKAQWARDADDFVEDYHRAVLQLEKAKRREVERFLDDFCAKDGFVPAGDRPGMRGTLPEEFQRGVEYTAQRLGMNVDEFQAHVQQIFDEADVYIRRRPGTGRRILKEQRFKSQFETGRSGGAFDPEYRASFEYNAFNTDFQVPRWERPTYGFFANNPHAASQLPARQYGRAAFRMKKDVIRKRTSYTWGDSFNEAKPGLWSEPDFTSLKINRAPPPGETLDNFRSPWGKQLGPTARREVYKNVDEVVENGSMSYLEAQIHGPVLVEDIEALSISIDGVRTAAEAKVAAARIAAKEYRYWAPKSVEVERYKRFADMVSTRIGQTAGVDKNDILRLLLDQDEIELIRECLEAGIKVEIKGHEGVGDLTEFVIGLLENRPATELGRQADLVLKL